MPQGFAMRYLQDVETLLDLFAGKNLSASYLNRFLQINTK